MVGAESSSSAQQDDNQASHAAKDIRELQASFEDILEQMKDDVDFSQLTPAIYEQKKTYLRKQLTDMLQKVIKYQQHQDFSNLSDINLLDDEVETAISEPDQDELEKYKKSLAIAKETISSLKGEESSKIFQENQQLKVELKGLQFCATMELDYRIRKFNTETDEYKSEISRLEKTLKLKEDKLNHELKNTSKLVTDLKKRLNTVRSDKDRISGKLETLQEEKCSQERLIQEKETRLNELKAEHERVVLLLSNTEKSENELNLKVEKLEREVNSQKEVISVTKEELKQISGRIETLEAEKCSQDRLLFELNTRLNALSSHYDKTVSLILNKLEDERRQVVSVLENRLRVERGRVISLFFKPQQVDREQVSALLLDQVLQHPQVVSSIQDLLQITHERVLWLFNKAKEI